MSRQIQEPTLRAPTPVYPVAAAALLDIGGTFPERGGGAPAATLGMVRMFGGGNVPLYGAALCDGRPLSVANNPALFSVLGTQFGGNGETGFDLPDLRGKIPVGTGSEAPFGRSVALTWLIAGGGSAGSAWPMTGTLGLFAGNYAPAGWLACDGALMSMREDVALFETIGTTFGGDGVSSFALPDLTGRAAVGAGDNRGISVALGAAVDPSANGDLPGLGLNYMINVAGDFPPFEGDGGFPPSASIAGEIAVFAGATVPAGWMPAQGQWLNRSDYMNLFQLVGTTYGGGFDQMQLPDLRGTMIAGLNQ